MEHRGANGGGSHEQSKHALAVESHKTKEVNQTSDSASKGSSDALKFAIDATGQIGNRTRRKTVSDVTPQGQQTANVIRGRCRITAPEHAKKGRTEKKAQSETGPKTRTPCSR